MVSSTPSWFDAHLDLAYLAECGRDMAAPLDPSAGPHPPAAVTFPSLAAGRVEACLGTIFTEAIDPGGEAGYETIAYPAGDADEYHQEERDEDEFFGHSISPPKGEAKSAPNIERENSSEILKMMTA